MIKDYLWNEHIWDSEAQQHLCIIRVLEVKNLKESFFGNLKKM